MIINRIEIHIKIERKKNIVWDTFSIFISISSHIVYVCIFSKRNIFIDDDDDEKFINIEILCVSRLLWIV